MSPISSSYRPLGADSSASRRGIFASVWIQSPLTLRPRPRGFHLVTDEIVDGVPELRSLRVGVAVVFMQHTSASLTLNENASPDVRRDFAAWFDRRRARRRRLLHHTLEGDDDMPAHIKSSLTGASLVLPVADGRLALGTWQGIYLCEHRDQRRPAQRDRDRVRGGLTARSPHRAANMCSCAGTT